MKLLHPRGERPPYATLPFFAGWSDDELARFSRLVEVIDYEPGDVIAAGRLGSREFALVLVGKVDVVQGRRRVGTLGEGDAIGAETMLTNTAPAAAAVAQTYVRALVLGPQQFHGLLHEVPSMGRRLAQLLAERLAALPSPA